MAISCDQIAVWSIYHERVDTHQLTKQIHAHNHTLGRLWEILQKRGQKDCRSPRNQEHHKKITESSILGTKGLTETKSTIRESAWDCLSTLHIYILQLCSMDLLWDS